MKPGKPPVEVTQELQHKAWLLHTRDQMTYRKIGEKLGMDHANAFRAVKRQQAQVTQDNNVEAKETMQIQTARLESVGEVAFADYQAGKKPIRIVKTVTRLAVSKQDKARADEQGMVRERIEEIRPGEPNPALLNVVRGALQDIRNIWGAEAAKIVEVKTIGDDDDVACEYPFTPGMVLDTMVSVHRSMETASTASRGRDGAADSGEGTGDA